MFVLDEDKLMYHIIKPKKGESYIATGMYDFSDHALDAVINDDWSRCHMHTNALTYNHVLYQSNSSSSYASKVIKTYFWYERVHTEYTETMKS